MAKTAWSTLNTAEGELYYYNSETEAVQWEKPAELLTEDEKHTGKGEHVWVPHPVKAFVPGYLVEVKKSGKSICEDVDGNQIVVEKNAELHPLNIQHLTVITDDLIMLPLMNEPLILHCLRERFALNQIYTNVGTILISINPYQRLPLYSEEIIEEYKAHSAKRKGPHVFLIASDAYSNLINNNENQAILISGESGAGKTECTKQCLQYLAYVAGTQNKIEEKVLRVNPILEAFGNAKTIRNNNSSRFGKYCEVFFDQNNRISGCLNFNYLLEKIRVVDPGDKERNFHIFYQLVKGGSVEQARFCLLDDNEQFTYLNNKLDNAEGMDDVEEWDNVEAAFHLLNYSADEMKAVMQVVALVLHLGNIEFRAGPNTAISSDKPLKKASKLLQVSQDVFSSNLCTQMLVIKGQKATSIPLNQGQAHNNINALAKFLYGHLFDWVVKRCNESLDADGAKKTSRTIGILDIFGFEIFEFNSFEQLCINFTNEKLQLFFNQHTFNIEQKIYEREKIVFEHVTYRDNQPVLDLIENKPLGILPALDEELRMPAGSEKAYVRKIHDAHKANPICGIDIQNPENFIIHHYAGKVMYNSANFLEKNRDTLSEDLLQLLGSSQFSFIRTIFPDLSAKMDTRNRKQTLGAQFTNQLNELMRTLTQTHPHYIRCIKPNEYKKPKVLQPVMVLEQLQYSGVFEAVRIRKLGFPFKLAHNKFFNHYRCVIPRMASHNVKDACVKLIAKMNQPQDQLRIGNSMILYRGKEHNDMELYRHLAQNRDVRTLQRWVRGCMARKFAATLFLAHDILVEAMHSLDKEKLETAIAQVKAMKLTFPLYILTRAERMIRGLVRMHVLSAEIEKLMTSPSYSFEQLKELVDEAKEFEVAGPWVEKAKCHVLLKESMDKFDEFGLREAISLGKKLQLDVEPTFKKALDKAEVVMQHIIKEKAIIGRLQAELSGKGRLERGDPNSLQIQVVSQLCVDAKVLGLKLPASAPILKVGEHMVLLRSAISLAITGMDGGHWKKVEQIVSDGTQLKPSVQSVSPVCAQESLDYGHYCAGIKLVRVAVETVDEQLLEEAVDRCNEWGMIGPAFAAVREAALMLQAIRETKELLLAGMAAVNADLLTEALDLATELNYKCELVSNCRELRDKIVAINTRVKAVFASQQAPSLSQLEAILDDADSIHMENEGLVHLETLVDDIVLTEKELESAIADRDEVDLEALIKHASDILKMTNTKFYPCVSEAKACIVRIQAIKLECMEALKAVVEAQLASAVRAADLYKYHTEVVASCRKLWEQVMKQNRLCQELLTRAQDHRLKTPTVDECQAVLKGAEELRLATDELRELRKLMEKIQAVNKRITNAIEAHIAPSESELDAVVKAAAALQIESGPLDALKMLYDDICETRMELTAAEEERAEDKLKAFLGQADSLNMTDVLAYPVVVKARQTLARIQELKKALTSAMAKVVQLQLEDACKQCESFRYVSQQVKDCQVLRDAVIKNNAACKSALNAHASPSIAEMEAILDESKRINLQTVHLNELAARVQDCVACTHSLETYTEARDEENLRRQLSIAREDLRMTNEVVFPVVSDASICLEKIVKLKELIVEAIAMVQEAQLKDVIERANAYKYRTPEVKAAKLLFARVVKQNHLCSDALKNCREVACKTPTPEHMQAILVVAKELHLETPDLVQLEDLLRQMNAVNELVRNAVFCLATLPVARMQFVLAQAKSLQMENEDITQLQALVDDTTQTIEDLKNAIRKRDEPALVELVARAALLKLTDLKAYPQPAEARECLKQISKLKTAVSEATSDMSALVLVQAMDLCDDYNYVTSETEACRVLRDKVVEVSQLLTRGLNARKLPSIPYIDDVIERAAAISWHHPDLDAIKSVRIQALELVGKLQEATRLRDEEKLNNLIPQADTLKLTNGADYPALPAAQLCLKRIYDITNRIAIAVEKVSESLLVSVCNEAEEFNYRSIRLSQCIELKNRVVHINQECTDALRRCRDPTLKSPKPDECEVILSAARLIKLRTDDLSALTLLQGKMQQIVQRANEAKLRPSVQVINSILADARELGMDMVDLQMLGELTEKINNMRASLQVAIEARAVETLELLLTQVGEFTPADIPELHDAKECIRRVKKITFHANNALSRCEMQLFDKAVTMADDYGFTSEEIEKCRDVRHKISLLLRSCESALADPVAPSTDDLAALLEDCNEVGFTDKCVSNIKHMIHQLDCWTDEVREAIIDREEGALVECMQQAKKLNVTVRNYPLVDEAKDVLQRIGELKVSLQYAMDHDDLPTVEAAVVACEEFGYRTEQVVDCVAYRDQLYLLEHEAYQALIHLKPEVMGDVLLRCEAIGMDNFNVKELRRLLYEVGEEQFVQIQLRAAVDLNDESRKRNLAIILKELMFYCHGEQVALQNFNRFYTSTEWAEFPSKLFSNKQKIASSYWTHQDTPLHHSLTKLVIESASNIVSDKEFTILNDTACKCFKSLLNFMGDRKSKKGTTEMESVQHLVNVGHSSYTMRDELYCQLIKQLTLNTSRPSIVRGWQLMSIYLESFATSKPFEAFLEYWLRVNGSSEMVESFHNLLYDPRKTSSLISVSRMTALIQQTTKEPTPDPMTKPKTGFKPDRSLKPHDWTQLLDMHSGVPCYFNARTGETSWDRPPSGWRKQQNKKTYPMYPPSLSAHCAGSIRPFVSAVQTTPFNVGPASPRAPVPPSSITSSPVKGQMAMDNKERSREVSPMRPYRTFGNSPVQLRSSDRARAKEREETFDFQFDDSAREGEKGTTSSPVRAIVDVTEEDDEEDREGRSEDEDSDPSSSSEDDSDEDDDDDVMTASLDMKENNPSSINKETKEWQTLFDPSTGLPYYYNRRTGLTVWEKPHEAVQEDLKQKQEKLNPVLKEVSPGKGWPSLPLPGSSPQAKVLSPKKKEEQAASPSPVASPASPAASAPATKASQAHVDKFWESVRDPASGDDYFFNSVTGDVTWERPAGFTK